MNLFFSRQIQGQTGILDSAESHHAIKVMRLKQGDEVSIIDGKGGLYEGIISIEDPKKCEIEILHSQQDYGKRNFSLHIAIAPTKNTERFEWFLEKATEIGISMITPLICMHSERKTLREDRLQKVIMSAVKQSQSAYLPVLQPMISFSEFIKREQEGTKLIAHCIDEDKKELIKLRTRERDFILLIGPEGDFDKKEISQALENGFQAVSLGNSRLRTETAGVAACQIIADLVALS